MVFSLRFGRSPRDAPRMCQDGLLRVCMDRTVGGRARYGARTRPLLAAETSRARPACIPRDSASPSRTVLPFGGNRVALRPPYFCDATSSTNRAMPPPCRAVTVL